MQFLRGAAITPPAIQQELRLLLLYQVVQRRILQITTGRVLKIALQEHGCNTSNMAHKVGTIKLLEVQRPVSVLFAVSPYKEQS